MFYSTGICYFYKENINQITLKHLYLSYIFYIRYIMYIVTMYEYVLYS